jgi:tRNA modification GTPase
MNLPDPNDTIAAISTCVGESGIGIVRLSGKESLTIADRVFRPKDGARPSTFATYTVHYGWVIDRARAGRVIDEALLTVMRAPRSYTKEDVVEINCHGGSTAVRSVLDAVLDCGARLASPGEFTRRAFLNGRIDLAQAEAVLDAIRAKTDAALSTSLQQLKGALSKEIGLTRGRLIEVLAGLEATIDFPEEDITPVDLARMRQALRDCQERLRLLIESAHFGRILREGANVVICGRPNVGKSSLLNALVRQERSIVTHIAGTTRDTIEEVMGIRGIPVTIVDTAGIIEPRDLIERKAIARARDYIRRADVVVLVFDGARRLCADDTMFMRRLKGKKTLAVINKIDVKQRIQEDTVRRHFDRVIAVSAKSGKNIEALEDAIAGIIEVNRKVQFESPVVTNVRHAASLRSSQKFIAQALVSLDNTVSPECISEDVKAALSCLDEITGEKCSDDVLERIFSEFCIGK